MHALSHRGRFQAQHLRHVRRGQLLEVAQDEGLAVWLGQAIDARARLLGQELPVDDLFRVAGRTELGRSGGVPALGVEAGQELLQRLRRPPGPRAAVA